jgi:hypothetical protein
MLGENYVRIFPGLQLKAEKLSNEVKSTETATENKSSKNADGQCVIVLTEISRIPKQFKTQ